MRIPSGSKKHHRGAGVGVFLIVAALVVGLIACDGARTYQLTVSSASGGNVTTPGEGTFTYAAGTAVPLVAAPDDGYQFGSWTGDIAHIAGPNLASTTVVMNGNCAIVANFQTEGGTGPGNGGHSQP
jgi:hypothetical protein